MALDLMIRSSKTKTILCVMLNIDIEHIKKNNYVVCVCDIFINLYTTTYLLCLCLNCPVEVVYVWPIVPYFGLCYLSRIPEDHC